MSELPTIAATLSAVDNAVLRMSQHLGGLRDVSDLVAPAVEIFSIDGAGDVGAAVRGHATRVDGRGVGWIVEAWIYPCDGVTWRASVKAEIDLDDESGEDRCVVNEQEVVDDPTAMVAAIGRATDVVLEYPLQPLLTRGWEPPDWDH